MKRRWVAVTLALFAAGKSLANPAEFPGPLQKDAATVSRLTADGERFELDNVLVFSEQGALSKEELTEFAEQASAAATGIREYLRDDLQLVGGDDTRAVELYLSADAGISHAWMREPRVFITPSRVRSGTAPYVHESVHVMVAWSGGAEWLSEGFADHVAARVVARKGGYLGLPLEPRGLAAAAEHARSPYGREVLPLIGAAGSRASVRRMYSEIERKISLERRTYAAAFYTLAWSFVDYLVSHVGIKGLRSIAEADGSDAAVLRSTGRTLDEWRTAWLATFD